MESLAWGQKWGPVARGVEGANGTLRWRSLLLTTLGVTPRHCVVVMVTPQIPKQGFKLMVTRSARATSGLLMKLASGREDHTVFRFASSLSALGVLGPIVLV